MARHTTMMRSLPRRQLTDDKEGFWNPDWPQEPDRVSIRQRSPSLSAHPAKVVLLNPRRKQSDDYRKAADLLPINWDNEYDGAATQGKNDLRINKIMALGYLGIEARYRAGIAAVEGCSQGW